MNGFTGLGTTKANEMNFVMTHAPGAGSITQPVDQESNVYYCTTDAPIKQDYDDYIF